MPTEGQRRICKKKITENHPVDRSLVSSCHSCVTHATAKSRAKQFSVTFIDIESKSRRFVVSSFHCFAIEMEESSKFQIFEFQTRPATIMTIAMAIWSTQSECAIEAQHISQIFG